ncbi:MAG: endo-1,4-beta-xylanase [Ignavibacteriales bacterium]|nr:endo-1,4-beta-xylanase [Ignavibacteriales bacterium]
MKVIQLHERFTTKKWSTSFALRIAIVACAVTLMSPLLASAQSDTIQTNVPALKNVFAKDFHIGCLLSYRNIGFPTDSPVTGQSTVVTPNGGYLVKFHMNSMTPGNNMKPQYTVDLAGSLAAYNAATTSQAKDSIDTHPIIRFNGDIIAQLNWARRQGFRFRGHTLVWHSQTPGTGFFRSGYAATGTRLTKAKMTDRLENYIKEVIRLIHEGWPGLLFAMDVVNEAVNDNTGTDRTTDSEWYQTFGDNSYIMKAFELARKYTVQYGESQIKLYYNDYNTDIAAKANGIVGICAPVFRAGYLDGIGMQGHDDISYPTADAWIASYNKFDAVCTEMAVTEYYVNAWTPTATPAIRAMQANKYAQLFKIYLDRSYFSGRGKIINLTKDGLNDQWTFNLNSSSLWDSTNQCKPAFYAVVNVGMNYHSLDSLISVSKLLQQNNYTATSWGNFSAVLASAKTAMSNNYSETVSAADALGAAKDNLKVAIAGLVKFVSLVDGNTPRAFALSQNYPNPFNPSTNFEVRIANRELVHLSVFDVLGRTISTLINEECPAGVYAVRWDASSLPSGVYYYRLQAGAFVETKQMVLMK